MFSFKDNIFLVHVLSSGLPPILKCC